MSTPLHQSPSQEQEQEQEQEQVPSSKRFKSKSITNTTQSGPAYRTRLRTRSSNSKQNPSPSPSPSPSSQITISNSTSTSKPNLTNHHQQHHQQHLIDLSRDPFPIDPALNGSPNRSPSSPSSSELPMNCECQRILTIPSTHHKPNPNQTYSTQPNLINLPGELLEEISNQLSNDMSSLLSLSLTHSRLNFFALKTLYHSPQLNSRYTAWKLRTTLRIHDDLSKFVRLLDIDLNKLCKASMWASWHLQETGGAVVDVLSQCQNLIDLRLQMPKESSMFMQEFIQPIRNLTHLQSFYKDLRDDQDVFNEPQAYRSNPAAWISMIQLLSMIGHLTSLHTLAIRGLGSSLSSKPIFKSQPISSRLKCLIIIQTSIKERDLQQLLRYSSGLKSLTLIESTCISKRGLVEALQSCGRSLEDLTIGPGWWGKSDTSFPIDDVIGSLHELKRLKVEGDLISPEFFKYTYETNPKKTQQVLVRLDALHIKKCNTFKFNETLRSIKQMIQFHSYTSPIVDPNGGEEECRVFSPPILEISCENLVKLGWKSDDLFFLNQIYQPGLFQHLS